MCDNIDRMGKRLKRMQVIEEDIYGVCLWQLEDGAYIGDGEGRFLSMYGHMRDPIIERKMLEAAKSYVGYEASLGRPVWLSGSRQVTDNEADDQMERLLEGYIPDVVDATKQILGGK